MGWVHFFRFDVSMILKLFLNVCLFFKDQSFMRKVFGFLSFSRALWK